MKSNFNLNTLKGRMAEQIIKDLFQQSGYNVFNFGLESLHPTLSKNIKFINNKMSTELRFLPDFVVQNSRQGDLFYLEVKFRADGCFRFDEKYDTYPYKNAWFVIVSPEKIQCMHYKRLIQKYEITPATNYLLTRIKSFNIDPKLLSEYESYSKMLFQSFAQHI
ncbi:MAG TPA: hypothetical protein PLS26_07210 [Bacteroidales bacterium]|nr:hypothetical protein [Bacteroidales bacterium]